MIYDLSYNQDQVKCLHVKTQLCCQVCFSKSFVKCIPDPQIAESIKSIKKLNYVILYMGLYNEFGSNRTHDYSQIWALSIRVMV